MSDQKFVDKDPVVFGPENQVQVIQGNHQLHNNNAQSGSRAAPSPGLQSISRRVLAIALVFLGAWTLREFLPSMAWALVFAVATWGLYERAGLFLPTVHHDVLLPLLATSAVGLVFVLPLGFALIEIGHETHGLADWATSAHQNGIAVPIAIEHLPFSASIKEWWTVNLANPQGLSDIFGRIDHDATITAGRHLGEQVTHRLVMFTFTLVTLFFLYRDGKVLSEQISYLARYMFGQHGQDLSLQIAASIHGTVNGLVLVGLGEGLLLGIVYLIAGAPHAVLLGAVTAVAAMIPFGAPLAFVLASALLFFNGSTTASLVVLAAGFLVSGIADHFVRPVLIGGTTHLPFIWVLFGTLGGVGTFGLLGLFLGPAIMAALFLLWHEWTSRIQTNLINQGD